MCRKLELLLLLLLERSVETRSLQDLVSHPRRWLSKESQAGEFAEFLLAEGNRASAVGKSLGTLCVMCLSCWSWVMLKDHKKRMPLILSIRVVSRLCVHHTTPTHLYSDCFMALQCFYLSGSTPVCRVLIASPQHRSREAG